MGPTLKGWVRDRGLVSWLVVGNLRSARVSIEMDWLVCLLLLYCRRCSSALASYQIRSLALTRMWRQHVPPTMVLIPLISPLLSRPGKASYALIVGGGGVVMDGDA